MPVDINRDLMDAVFELIATTDNGLEQVLAELRKSRADVVSVPTIYRWLERDEELREHSARARRLQAELLHDRAQVAATTPMIGERRKVDADGRVIEITTGDNVERSKLIVQTLLRRAGQLDPKKYGDRTVLAGDPTAPIEHKIGAGDLIDRIIGADGK